MADIEKVLDGLERLKFFNQRAGRELWNDKPKAVQQEDIENAETTFDQAIQTIRELQKQIPKWNKVELKPLTEEEKKEYGEDCDFIYDCETPDDGQEVLVATKWGVDKTTYYTDCGCYFENYEDEGEVIAWMELPKFEEVE